MSGVWEGRGRALVFWKELGSATYWLCGFGKHLDIPSLCFLFCYMKTPTSQLHYQS